MPVNQKAVEEFCTTLEGNEFEQYAGGLNGSDNKRCCLGVACEVYMKITGDGEWKKTEGDSYYEFLGSTGFLPKKVANFFGFDYENPVLKHESGKGDNATSCNDALEMSFKEIAAAFRRTYLT